MNIYQDVFESDDDDENDEDLLIIIVRKPYTVRPRPDIFNGYDADEFMTRFRLRKVTVIRLLELIEERIVTATMRNNAITPLHQLLLTLRFYATGTFQIAMSDFAGLHKSTACRIIKRVTIALALLRQQYITIPEDQRSVRKTQKGFYDIARFPRVIGAIDCTHVKIQSPGGEAAEVFRNRKGFFSINVQAVCNAQLQFIDIIARWPGSTHDSTIFNASRVHARCIHGEIRNAVFLGDSGYACTKFLLTPLLQTRNRAEELYNESQIRTRNVIERAFGVWKRRFPILAVGMRLRVPTVQAIIVATAVLHNIAREMNDPDPPVDFDIEQQINELQNLNADVVMPMDNERDVRRTLIDTYFTRLL